MAYYGRLRDLPSRRQRTLSSDSLEEGEIRIDPLEETVVNRFPDTMAGTGSGPSGSETSATTPKPEIFITNPYLGNINPGSSDGQKLFLKAIAKRDDRLSISQEKVKEILTAFESDS